MSSGRGARLATVSVAESPQRVQQMVTFINVCGPVVTRGIASQCRIDVVDNGDGCLSSWDCLLCGQRGAVANPSQDYVAAMTRAKRLAFRHWRREHSPLRG
jgi:hypothetical protein